MEESLSPALISFSVETVQVLFIDTLKNRIAVSIVLMLLTQFLNLKRFYFSETAFLKNRNTDVLYFLLFNSSTCCTYNLLKNIYLNFTQLSMQENIIWLFFAILCYFSSIIFKSQIPIFRKTISKNITKDFQLVKVSVIILESPVLTLNIKRKFLLITLLSFKKKIVSHLCK